MALSSVNHYTIALSYLAETSSHSSSGSPHLLIGIMAGLLTTLVVLAFLIVVLLKVHTRRHPPPPMYSEATGTASAVASETNNPSTNENPSRLNNAVKPSTSSARKAGLFHTSTSSQSAGAGSEQDPDLIPLQQTSKLTPHLGKYLFVCLFF